MKIIKERRRFSRLEIKRSRNGPSRRFIIILSSHRQRIHQKERMKMTEIRTEKKIDGVTAPKLDARLKEALAGGETELVIDMDETTYISSVGLRAFVSAQKRINKTGGSMVLTHVKPCILEIFEVTGFAGVLTIES